MAKKDEEKIVVEEGVEPEKAEAKQVVDKEVKQRKSPTVKVQLRVKQLIGGKRGFVDDTGTIKLLEGMKFQFGEQEVDADVWDSAEVYKKF